MHLIRSYPTKPIAETTGRMGIVLILTDGSITSKGYSNWSVRENGNIRRTSGKSCLIIQGYKDNRYRTSREDSSSWRNDKNRTDRKRKMRARENDRGKDLRSDHISPNNSFKPRAYREEKRGNNGIRQFKNERPVDSRTETKSLRNKHPKYSSDEKLAKTLILYEGLVDSAKAIHSTANSSTSLPIGLTSNLKLSLKTNKKNESLTLKQEKVCPDLPRIQIIKPTSYPVNVQLKGQPMVSSYWSTNDPMLSDDTSQPELSNDNTSIDPELGSQIFFFGLLPYLEGFLRNYCIGRVMEYFYEHNSKGYMKYFVNAFVDWSSEKKECYPVYSGQILMRLLVVGQLG
ncbi:hypothetical protein RF11_07530 [Thelohanellus kitauei]|uniref:Uncharacterized protein n=1 Tax=Thelohanellus kitauei TaxID=669202 RepID=A0A0C2IFZ5_THEKT|nr:hypothetical protein RF11_07530 [Thelohanellus kitauei]